VILFLLQGQVSYLRSNNNPVVVIALGVVIGAIILFVLINSIVKNGLGMGKGMTKGSGSPRRFSAFTLHRISRTHGLNRDQAKVLEYVLKSNGVIDADRTVANPALLDRQFKQTYRQIEKNSASPEDAQQKMSMLFSTRNAIEMYHNTSPGPAQQLSTGMEAVLSANDASYQVKVISAQKNSVLVECPCTSVGTKVRFARGTRAQLAYFSKANKGFSFGCQIQDTENTSFGPALQLSRGPEVKAMTKRRFRRRQVALDCGYYMVHLEETKKKKPPKLTIDRRRILGTITDLSIGGCAIKTQNSVAAGSRLKIEFDSFTASAPIAVLGQVLRINRTGLSYSIMHVRFLKVPQKAMNTINALVFGFKDD